LVCRSKEKGEEAVQQIKDKTGNQNVHLHICDVSSTQQIKQCVKDFEAAGYSLDVLVPPNNKTIHYSK
jgi:dehydrogenase/reductase SDR family protein 12